MTNSPRTDWKTYRFDEMAIEVKDRVEIPRESGFERYVGLTHLDAGSLKSGDGVQQTMSRNRRCCSSPETSSLAGEMLTSGV